MAGRTPSSCSARAAVRRALRRSELDRVGRWSRSPLVPEGRARLSRGRRLRRLLHRPHGRPARHPRAFRRPRDRARDLGPGDFFGELAMLDGGTRSASVETLSDAELLALPAIDMRRVIAHHGEIAAKLIVALTRRLRETNERVARQSFQTVPSRVAGVLSQLIAEEAIPEDREGVTVRMTQADLAQLAGHLARERQPLPRHARARRGRRGRPRPGDGPGAARAARLHLLTGASGPLEAPAARWSSASFAARDQRRARTGGDGRGPARALRAGAPARARTPTRRCRSATGRRSPSPGSSPRSARPALGGDERCWRSAPAPATRPRCSRCSPRVVRSSATRSSPTRPPRAHRARPIDRVEVRDGDDFARSPSSPSRRSRSRSAGRRRPPARPARRGAVAW